MRRNLDLWLVAGLIAVQLLVVGLGIDGVVRVASGVLTVLLLPGYSFLAALFPRRTHGLDAVARVALALPVSLALVVLVGLALNPLGLSVQPARQVVWLTLLPAGFLALAARRRSAIASEFRGAAWLIGAYVGIALVLALVAGRGHDVQLVPHVSIYLVPGEGNLHEFPDVVPVGTSVKYVLGGEYFDSEKTNATLTVDVITDNTVDETPQLTSREVRTARFEPGTTWTQSIEVALTEPGSYVVENRLQLDDPGSSPVTVRLRLQAE